MRRVASIPTVENAWRRAQPLAVHGWIYGMHDGLLRNLGPTLTSIAERDALPSIDDCVRNPVEPVSDVHRLSACRQCERRQARRAARVAMMQAEDSV